VVLLVGHPGLTVCLSQALNASADWPQGLRLVNLGDQATSPSGGEAQALAAWRADGQVGRTPLCTLLASSAQGGVDHVTCTQAWREALAAAGWPHAVLHGDAVAQQAAALAVVLHAWARAQRGPESGSARKWRWVCEDCDDGDCEQHWLPGAGKFTP
jgi:hypothetical protein